MATAAVAPPSAALSDKDMDELLGNDITATTTTTCTTSATSGDHLDKLFGFDSSTFKPAPLGTTASTKTSTIVNSGGKKNDGDLINFF